MLLFDTDGQSLLVRQLQFKHRALAAIEKIASREWDSAAKLFKFPLSEAPQILAMLQDFGVNQSEAFRRHMGTLVREQRAAEEPIVVTDYTFKTNPYEHQVRAFHLARSRPVFALLMEMGTGKTKVMIDVLSWLMQQGHIGGALVLAPKAVLYSWQRELETHSPLPPEARRSLVITGYTYQKRDAMKHVFSVPFIITNYETPLNNLHELMEVVSRKRLAVVCDESTKIKSHKAKTFKAARALGNQAPRRYIMTGSPITQSPLDAFAQFNFLDPEILGHQTFTSFKAEYAISVKLRDIKIPIVKGFKNLDRLAKDIKPHSLRVLKEECLDLPEKVFKVIELDMGPEQAEFYRQMRDEAVVTPDPLQPALAAPVILTKLMRLQQIASGFLPVIDEFGETLEEKPIADAPKLDAALEVIEEAIESGQRVIVWCRFVWEVTTLARMLHENAIRVVTYYGETSTADRQAAVDALQDGTVDVFIGQVQTGGMGITLTAASTVVYVSNTFSLAERLQSEDRAHRIGQKRSVLYVDLVCRGSVDNVVLKAHREKKNLADIVTGDSLARILGGHF